MRHARLALLALLALLAALSVLAAACGGGGDDPEPSEPSDPPSAEEEVRTAVVEILAETDGTVVCEQHVTARFLEEVFRGDRERCAEAAAPEPGEEPDDAEVLTVEVAGEEATVEVAHRGGALDGLEGDLGLVREGEAWKLDRYGDDYLRSVFAKSADAAADAGGTGAMTYAPLRECMVEQVTGEPAPKMRRFVLASIREDPTAKKAANDYLAACPKELTGYVTEAITAELSKGDSSPAFVRCVRKAIGGLLYATGLSKEVLKGNVTGASTAALQGLALGAAQQCADKR